MKIDITKLKNSIEKQIEISEKIVFNDDDIKSADMLSLEPVLVKGIIKKNSFDNYNVILNITGKMVLPCAITLKPVDYPFNISFDEIFSENAEEMSKKIKNCENSIDILPIVWENILMEIPMKVVSPDASYEKLEGEGWKIVTEDCESINPELAKLKDLLDKKEV